MNYSLILKILSMVFAIMALAFSLSAGVSVYYYSGSPLEGEALPAWISIIALSIMLTFAFFLPSRTASGKLFKKEAMCIVGLGWTLASLLGALPYIMIIDASFSDAFFESASGLTTTGASVFGDFSNFPKSLMFWRCLSHWIGGLGVIVFFVAILSFLGSDGRTLYSRETSAASGGGMETERIQSAALRIMGLYSAISVVCALTFRLCGMGWYDAVCHMFSTVSTGGFSVYEDSIARYDNLLICWAVTFFMFVGGIGFSVIIYFASGHIRKALQNTEFKVYAAILALSGIAVTIAVYASSDTSQPFFRTLTYGMFNTVSIMTTTGFIEKSFRPRVVRPVRINGKIIDEDDAYEVLSYVTMFALIVMVSILAISFFETDLELSESITAVISLINNVGPGVDRIGPAENYGFMNGASKIFLSVLMIMGRLEFYAVLALFMPSLWRKFQ